MPLVDTSQLNVIERLPGWRARIFNSASMTFAHYEFDAGSTIHEHHHEQGVEQDSPGNMIQR